MNDDSTERYTHERLERMELKMDRLLEAVAHIARLEERVGQSILKTDHLENDVEALRQRVVATEAQLAKSSVYANLAERGVAQLVALAGAAVCGALFSYFRWGGQL